MEHRKLKDLSEEELLKLEITCSSFYLSYSKNQIFKSQHSHVMELFPKRYENEVWLVITACFRAIRKGNICSKLSLNKTHYEHIRKEGFKINYNRTRYVLQELECKGYITLFIGDRHQHEVNRRTSIVRFENKMLGLFEKEIVNRCVKGTEYEDLVEVRNTETKESLKGTKFRGIKPLRDEVKVYNEILDKTDITLLGIPCGVQYKRVFFDDLKSSGRYYSGTFQTIKSKFRKFILFDGEETVEIDISSIHPMIIACRQKLELPLNHKPYDCYDGLKGNTKHLRSLFKQALLCMLYAAHEVEAKCSLLKHYNEEYYKKGKKVKGNKYESIKLNRSLVNKIFDKLVEYNDYLVPFLYRKDSWKQLQYYDSSICRIVVNRFVGEGIPILPYHDSFIVPKSKEDLLRSSIKEAWKEVLKVEYNLRVEIK